ncbi:phage tail tube protein [Eubacterium barkeri]|uniref:Phage tail tube protein n=1 Tax=Eubacterium barkeri TaxID=1528 RepID=A0A1H3HEH6_EUBBA|nr:phage tail tube protein [Eubacterium barkeri]SDY13164.1 hypothetical protein SAMN04488579_11742 [Eubacterium barkeri]
MVHPVYKLKFKVGTSGLASEEAAMVVVKNMETFEITVDGNVEDWTSMENDGWASALMTGKSFSISLKGKRDVGDPGNDYVAAAAWKDGLDCSTKAQIEFPDGAKLVFNAVLDVKTIEGADSTNVAPLEFDMIGDGKPTYTPAPKE